MRVNFILLLFREDIVRALFWTLVHSLWQGLALAMLTGLVILLTRRSNPVLRYNMLLGLFCLFLAAAGTTFYLQLRGAESALKSPALAPDRLSPAADTPILNNLFMASEQPLTGRLISYFNQKAGFIVAIWLIILFIRLLKVTVSLGTVTRLRYYRSSIPDAHWQERIKALAQRIGINKGVVLLESAIIQVPMMAGVFKPVILVPLGLLSQLPPQQVEAILLHELAHIRRKDYLVNLLQSVAGIIFFFNPAVLWISSLIREERENCCDDIAVGETRSKKEFIHALVSFQEYKQSAAYALAFPGSKNHLLERVKRIVHNDNKTLNIREKLFLLVCVFITAGLTMAYSRQTPEKVRPEMVGITMGDTSKPNGPAMRSKAVIMNDAVTDTTITPEQRRQWEQMTQRQKEAFAEQQKRLEAAEQRLLEQEKELTAQQERLNVLYADALSRMQELRDSVHGRGSPGRLQEPQTDNPQREEQSRKLEGELRHRRLELGASNRKLEAAIRDSKRNLDASNRKLEEDMRVSQWKLEEAAIQQQQGQSAALYAQKRSEYHLARTRDDNAGRNNKYVAPIIELLLDKKLITETNIMSFSLDKDGLTVNGNRQAEEVFRIFKEKFLDDPQDYVRYTRKEGMESTSINRYKD
jgi:bla regulator protein BlaR1